ncbi:TraR/DksA family transcriptional regulator [Desulfobotulus mexicanus]|uniref:TraR/DksA family transcriptional regulator n=1 Tax=Desulfobotulus mexicanus TaxID=2586642 RepID=A0A5Q4VE98_9BACT|nr:TraR/DksA C4-type zinc finger protein [Desulfobotulus mexicanus]TYT75278.1 TraR/DksA family transcriptional regulator [Desulfobotulus mexicanus]
MEKTKLEACRQRLEERLEEILKNQAFSKEENSPLELDQARVGRLSRMDAMQQRAMSKATSSMLNAEKNRIEIALKRIKANDYGYCMHCDEEIGPGRLSVDPSILICISCARLAESSA